MFCHIQNLRREVTAPGFPTVASFCGSLLPLRNVWHEDARKVACNSSVVRGYRSVWRNRDGICRTSLVTINFRMLKDVHFARHPVHVCHVAGPPWSTVSPARPMPLHGAPPLQLVNPVINEHDRSHWNRVHPTFAPDRVNAYKALRVCTWCQKNGPFVLGYIREGRSTPFYYTLSSSRYGVVIGLLRQSPLQIP